MGHSSFLRRPPLAHEFKQMGKRLVVGAPFGFRELLGPFVELGRHLGGLSRRTTQCCQDAGQFFEVQTTRFGNLERRRRSENG